MDAIHPYARELQQKLVERGLPGKVELFTRESGQISDNAWKAWEKATLGRIVPLSEVRASKLFHENKAWIERVKREGYTIIDLGNPQQRGLSDFYEMEKEVLSL